MNYEVIESAGQWIVHGDGVELARFDHQNDALNDVAERLRDAGPGDETISLRLSYQTPGK